MTRSRTYRRDTLAEVAQKVTITVPQMSMRQLVRRSIRHYNQRNPDKKPASLDSDPQFVTRISVNFLRHLTEYDSTRDFLRQHARDSDHLFVGAIVKGRVLRLIADQYPLLRDEARQQAGREDQVVNQSAPPGSPTARQPGR